MLTISTKTDVCDATVERVKKHIECKCDYYHVVLEHGANGKLHLHAIMLYPNHMEKKQLRNNMWTRYVKPHHADDGSRGSVAVLMQVAPGPRWYDEYLRKEDEVEVVTTKWDNVLTAAYFPDAHTQSILQASNTKGSRDGWIASHLDDYKSKYDENTFDAAYTYTFGWFVENKRDPNERILRERAHFLFRIASGDYTPMPGDRAWHNQRAADVNCSECGAHTR